jgi:hypothetical protein
MNLGVRIFFYKKGVVTSGFFKCQWFSEVQLNRIEKEEENAFMSQLFLYNRRLLAFRRSWISQTIVSRCLLDSNCLDFPESKSTVIIFWLFTC